MKSNHKVPVVRIEEIRKHNNADSLEIIPIPGTGYQVVTKLGQFKVGDLGVYVQPDSVVPQTEPFKFIWEGYQCEPDGQTPERKRRITVRRFRKEWSEGLLLPVSDFLGVLGDPDYMYSTPPQLWKEGEDVSEILEIAHWEPEEQIDIHNVCRKQQYKWPPKSLKGWFYWIAGKLGFDLNGPVGGDNEKGPKNPPPVYDVEAFKNFATVYDSVRNENVSIFYPGEQVIVTEKIHGSNARFMFDGKKFYAGSRKLWKSPKSSCVWREAVKQNPWIEEWCRANPGYTLFGEVCPTQQGFNYGWESGLACFYLFDILNPKGEYLPYAETSHYFAGKRWAETVPLLYHGPFDEAKIKALVDGPSCVPGAKHIREGVVIRPVVERHVHGLGRLQLKLVSNAFLEKDSK